MNQCKCEHWQECPVCRPHRFDADGNRLPPEPTQQEKLIEALKADNQRLMGSLRQAHDEIDRLTGALLAANNIVDTLSLQLTRRKYQPTDNEGSEP